MEELIQRLTNDSNILNTQGLKREEVMFFIYNNYVVSVFKLIPISDEKRDEIAGDFENSYVVYDVENDEVFNEKSEKHADLFEKLPQIDNVLFDYDYTYSEQIETAKRKVKNAVSRYLEEKIVPSSYVDGLMTIYGYIDESTKDLIKFFIDNSNK